MATRALTGSSLSLTRMILTPEHSGEAHLHSNADEVIYIIKGRVEVRAGVEIFWLDAIDASAFLAVCRTKSIIVVLRMPS